MAYSKDHGVFAANPIDLALHLLKERKINNSENERAIYIYPEHAMKIAIGLEILNEYGVMTEQNRHGICTHAELADEMAVAIIMLHRSRIDTLSNRFVLSTYPNRANVIAASFEYLKKASLLTVRNKAKICTIQTSLTKEGARDFLDTLSCDFLEKKLTQTSFDNLCDNRGSIKNQALRNKINESLFGLNSTALLNGLYPEETQQKIQAILALQVLVEGEEPVTEEAIAGWYACHKESINYQRNKFHRFFIPHHQTATKKLLTAVCHEFNFKEENIYFKALLIEWIRP